MVFLTSNLHGIFFSLEILVIMKQLNWHFCCLFLMRFDKRGRSLFVGSHNYEMFDNPNSPRFHIEKEFVFLYGRVSYVEVGLMDRG